jgi:hypothetical protein
LGRKAPRTIAIPFDGYDMKGKSLGVWKKQPDKRGGETTRNPIVDE